MNIQKLIPIAEAYANLSKDPSTKVGCIVVGPDMEVRSSGWNGFPRQVDESISSRHVRPTKYLYTSHAEENAICNAARVGIPLSGCTLIVTALFPCNVCARLIIQSGITNILAPIEPSNTRWTEEAKVALEMMDEAGVNVSYYTTEGHIIDQNKK